MAKFTVLFNDSTIQNHNFEEGIIHIGRDETNDIHIDSLSVALAHAVIVLGSGQSTIRYLNDSFPLFVNDEKTKEHILTDGDKIGVGKHIIVFNSEGNIATETEQIGAQSFNLDASKVSENDAYLQVVSGKHIGRVIPLRKAMTKIGQDGDGVAIIAKRKEGYFISALESHPAMKVNDKALGDDTLQLQGDDKVEMEDLSMLFYLD